MSFLRPYPAHGIAETSHKNADSVSGPKVRSEP
jgi:hypothetical protein